MSQDLDTEDFKAQACLLVLTGLPGAGKTTLARALGQEAALHGVDVRHVCFDQHGCQPGLHIDGSPQSRGHASAAAFSPEAWRQARQSALAQLEAELGMPACRQQEQQSEQASAVHESPALCSKQGQRHAAGTARQRRLVIADDNMQYRSMRGECYALARAAGAAIVLLYLRCTEALAQQRNRSRPEGQRVPPDVITRMAAQLEEPGTGTSEASQWERGCLLALSGDEAAAACQQDAAALWQRIWLLWGPPAPPPYDAAAAAAAKAAAQAVTAASRQHAVDLATRHVLSRAMQRTQAGPPEGRAAAAQRLNSMRRDLLQQAQQQAAAAGNAGLAFDHWVALYEQQCEAVLNDT